MKVKHDRIDRSLSKNILRVLSANFIVAVVGFIGSFVFPRILSIEDYAYYHTFTLYVSYLGILHLGYPSGMGVNYAGKDYCKIDKAHYKFEMILLISIIVVFSLIFFTLYLYSGKKMVLYISFAIIPVCLLGSWKTLLQAWSRFKEYGRINTIAAVTVPIFAIGYYYVSGSLLGSMYIMIYLIVNWGLTIWVLCTLIYELRNVKITKVDYRKLYHTEVTGAGILIGNYVNVLLTSADKQFVKCFFTDKQFAYYSFGMSMQVLMTVFLSSVAQPLFPKMASDEFDDNTCDTIKDFLLIFGSFSGLAYFGASIIVNLFIKNYIPSLGVISIYFVVFPLLAVINCLYVNLYKIKEKMKQYIVTLVKILILDIILNWFCIVVWGRFECVAIATSIIYVIWFVVGTRQFAFIHITRNNIMYLLVYLVGYFLILQVKNAYLGFVLYLVFLVLIVKLFFRNQVKLIFYNIMGKRKL